MKGITPYQDLAVVPYALDDRKADAIPRGTNAKNMEKNTGV